MRTYETQDPIQDPSHNVEFELDSVDTGDNREDSYERANTHLKNKVINQLSNLRIPQS